MPGYLRRRSVAHRHAPRQLTMLGGTVALDGAVEARLKRLLGTP